MGYRELQQLDRGTSYYRLAECNPGSFKIIDYLSVSVVKKIYRTLNPTLLMTAGQIIQGISDFS